MSESDFQHVISAALRDALFHHGPQLLGDPARLRAALQRSLPDKPAEVGAVVAAVEDRIPELLSVGGPAVPPPSWEVDRLGGTLAANRGLDPALATAAVAEIAAAIQGRPWAQHPATRRGQPVSLPARSRHWPWLLAAGVAVVVLAAAVVVVGTVLARSDGEPSAGAPPAPPGTGTDRVRCTYSPSQPGNAAPVPRQVSLPPGGDVSARGAVDIGLSTNQGRVSFRLDRTQAPCTVNSFVSLAKRNFFDETPCHRLTTTGIYVLQCGDPGGTGAGDPGYTTPDENLPAAAGGGSVTYPAGTIAMANAGPDTNGSQFFIVYRDTQLPPAYPIFGKVISGLDVVQQVAVGGSNPPGDGRPRKAGHYHDCHGVGLTERVQKRLALLAIEAGELHVAGEDTRHLWCH